MRAPFFVKFLVFIGVSSLCVAMGLMFLPVNADSNNAVSTSAQSAFLPVVDTAMPTIVPSPTIDFVPTQVFLISGWATSAAETDKLRDDLAAKDSENQQLKTEATVNGAIATSENWNAQKAISDNNLKIAEINSTLTPQAERNEIDLLAEQNRQQEIENKANEIVAINNANALTERAQYIIGAALLLFFVLGAIALRRPRAAQPMSSAKKAVVTDRTWERRNSSLKDITPPGDADAFLRFAIMVRNDPSRTLAKDKWEKGDSPYTRMSYLPVYDWMRENRLVEWLDDPRGLFLNSDGEDFFDNYIDNHYLNSTPPSLDGYQNIPQFSQATDAQTPENEKSSGEVVEKADGGAL